MFPLELGIKRRVSRDNDPDSEKANREFANIRDFIISERDNFTCQGCGFRSEQSKLRPSGYLEVHHINDDHQDNRKENLVTLCPFCHSVFTLGYRGDVQSGILIFSNVSQNYINRLSHLRYGLEAICAHYVSKIKKEEGDEKLLTDAASLAQHYLGNVSSVLNGLEEAGVVALEEVGNELNVILGEEYVNFNEIFTNASKLKNVLLSLQDSKYDFFKETFLSRMKMIPDLNTYENEVVYWSNKVWVPAAEELLRLFERSNDYSEQLEKIEKQVFRMVGQYE